MRLDAMVGDDMHSLVRSPDAAKYAGTLIINDNLEPNEMQEVSLNGKGKQPKTK